ncbi:HD domain-containing protein [Candidatus Woesearchaeota archaeon]|nr:HD domain-containing protein [Candidatus Woesearchaeota archaeon]
MDLIQRALVRAYDLHKSQVRKGNGAPYFVHLVDTAKYLMYETSDDEVICAGILHDTLEDTSYSEDGLREEFGERVFSLVKFCTELGNNHDSTKEELVSSWKVRKSLSIAKLDSASDDELLVFCADKVSTLLSIREDLLCGVDIWGKLNGSREEVFWYYSEIQKKLGSRLGDKRIFKIYVDLMSLFS